jgi:hypothetical protein
MSPGDQGAQTDSKEPRRMVGNCNLQKKGTAAARLGRDAEFRVASSVPHRSLTMNMGGIWGNNRSAKHTADNTVYRPSQALPL